MIREKTVFVHDKLITWNINNLIFNMMLCTHYYIVRYHFSDKNALYVYASLLATEEQYKMSNLLFYNWSHRLSTMVNYQRRRTYRGSNN
jgi:hypothetical protein